MAHYKMFIRPAALIIACVFQWGMSLPLGARPNQSLPGVSARDVLPASNTGAAFDASRAESGTGSPSTVVRQNDNRFIQWLKKIAGIRKPLVLLYPDGKVMHEGDLAFRWGWKLNENPDHFIIRVVEKSSAAEREVWVSEGIPGNQRTFTKTPGLENEPGKTYVWKVESYEKDAHAFSIQNEQSFSFLTTEQSAAIRQREAAYLAWLEQRPGENHLLLLIGSYYASEGIYSRAREMFTRFLELRHVAAAGSVLSYKELTTLVWKELERVETERNTAQSKLGKSSGVARTKLLGDLYQLNLTLLDYEQAMSNVDSLIALSASESERANWQQVKGVLREQQALMQQLFPPRPARGGARNSMAVPFARPIALATKVSSVDRGDRLARVGVGANAGRRSRRQESRQGFSLELAPDMAAWYEADDEFFAKYQQPGEQPLKPSYYFGEEISQLIEGLWRGDMLSSVRDPLGREMLRRSILNFFVTLVKLKAGYLAGGEKTPTLDAAWSLIPEQRSLKTDQAAFSKFARIIYPDPLELGSPDIMKSRDELIRYLDKHMELPKGDPNDDKFLEQVLFYNIFVGRTLPVFELGVAKSVDRLAVNSVEVVNEGFAPLDGDIIPAAARPGNEMSFTLNGSCPDLLMKKMIPGSFERRAADKMLIRFESKRKGAYRLRIRLKSSQRILWESPSFGLYFI